MKSYTLLQIAAGAFLWNAFPFINIGSVHALPVHASDDAADSADMNLHCPGLGLSDSIQGVHNPCVSKRNAAIETKDADDTLVARSPRFMMAPKVAPKPKPKPKAPSQPGKGPKEPGSDTPGPLQPGLTPGTQNQAPSNGPERLTGDPSPNPPKDPASDPDKPSPKPEDDPDQKPPKDDKKNDDELQEPMLMEPMPPGPSTTNPDPTDPSRREPLTSNPGSNPTNKGLDAEIAKKTEGIWKVDNGPGQLVTPTQITDTMEATAQFKNIQQGGSWWSFSGADVEKFTSTNPKAIENINSAIVSHKTSSGSQSPSQKRQSVKSRSAVANETPASMQDVIPADAQKHWQGMGTSGNGTESDTSNRMRYAYATWIRGDNFYVISTPKSDAGVSTKQARPPTSFEAFELPYITTPRDSASGPFQAIYQVNVKADGTVAVDPTPIWVAGEEPMGTPSVEDWMKGQETAPPIDDDL